MSKENVKRLFEELARDRALQEKFKAAGKAYEGQEISEEKRDLICQNELLPLAKQAGCEFTLAEFKEYAKETSKPRTGELSEDELTAVAGGAGGCGCFLAGGGGGSKDGKVDGACGCVAMGFGNPTMESGSKGFCHCAVLGGGGWG